MIKLEKDELELAHELVESCEDYLVKACLEGHVGQVYVDRMACPTCVKVMDHGFCFIFVKEGKWHKDQFQSYIEDVRDETIITASEEVKKSLHKRGHCYVKERYDLSFNPLSLEQYDYIASKVPEGYRIQPITEESYDESKLYDWSYDLCGNYNNYEAFKQHGVGYVVYEGQQLVSGASSYCHAKKGIEVVICTHLDHRRKGLAMACAAALIKTCLQRGLYPRWDAANKASVALAEKLGYDYRRTYESFILKQQEECK